MMNKNTSTKRIVSLVLAVVMFAALLTVGMAADSRKIFVNGKEIAANETVTAENGSVIVKIVPFETSDVVTVNGKEVKVNENGEFVLYTATPDTADAPETDDTPDTPDTPDEPVVAQGLVALAVTDKDGNVFAFEFTLEDAAATTDEPTPDVPTPDVPTPDVPTPDEPTPDVPTPDVPTPDEPTPDVPTPDVPTPDEPTPDVPTPDVPTPDVPTPDQPKTEKYLNGDVDFDKSITSNDAVLILRYSVEKENFNEIQKVVGDVNGDKINYSDDALTVLRASVGLETINPEYVDVVVG